MFYALKNVRLGYCTVDYGVEVRVQRVMSLQDVRRLRFGMIRAGSLDDGNATHL